MQPLKLEEYVRKDELQDMLKQILQHAQEGVTKDEQTIPTTQSTIVKRTVV
jgi:hypothetical protein